MPTLQGGNILLPHTTFAYRMRLPPTLKKSVAINAINKTILENPPSKSKISILDLNVSEG